MCGIVAFLNREHDRPADRECIARMTEAVRHRGPDDGGLHLDGPAGLGHRRLSVIDIGGGHQPMCGPSGHTWIAYNGEVFNYRELREELSSHGVRFRTASDTEVLLALFEREGPTFVERLNGMFAFAIWDARERCLLLARDRMGVKPLYVWDGPRTLVAASEIKAILAYPEVPRQMQKESLAEFMAFRQLSGERTMFSGIRTMQPGTVELHRYGGSSRIVYWKLPLSERSSESIPASKASVELRALLSDAVRLRLVSDVPLGTFNSGGLDSSIVTALASRMVSEPLRTFSVGFEDREYDERIHARRVSENLGTIHNEVLGDGTAFADLLPQCVWHHDEPLNHANSVLILILSRFAKRQVTVVLTGEGADELFAGYPRYRIPRVMDRLRLAGRWPESVLAHLLRHSRGRRIQLLSSMLGAPAEQVIASNARYVLEEEVCTEALSLRSRTEDVPEGRDLFSRTLSFDQRTYLHNVLERMDKMTMAAGLEARVPFLDYRIVEFAARLNTSTKMPLLRTKAVVKAAAKGLLPPTIARRPKSGFGVPLAMWMREPENLGRYLDMLKEERTVSRGWWHRSRLHEIVDRHLRGEDHVEVLWSLVNCELWARLMLDSPSHVQSDAVMPAIDAAPTPVSGWNTPQQ